MTYLLKSDLAVVDLETTGVNPFQHDVVAVGIVPISENSEPLLVYVNSPNIIWSEFARANFSKFANEWKNNSLGPSDACNEIENYISEIFSARPVTLVGHNVGFDVSFMRKLAFLGGRNEIAGISHRAIDTHTLLYTLCLQGKVPVSILTSSGAFEYFGIEIPESVRHTALGDAMATRDLFLRILSLFDVRFSIGY